MSRAPLIIVLLLLIAAGGYSFYWFSKAVAAEDRVRTNLENVAASLKAAGEGASLSYESVEAEGFPFGVSVVIRKPVLEVASTGRNLQLRNSHVRIVPEIPDGSRYHVRMPKRVYATAKYPGKNIEYVVDVKPLPKLAFRTPIEQIREVELAKRSPVPLAGKLPDVEELKKLSSGIIHQFSVGWPGSLTLDMKMGEKAAAQNYSFPIAMGSARLWQRNSFYIKYPVERFFSEIERAFFAVR